MPALEVLRPHQWLKNLLLFVPLVTSQTVPGMDSLKMGFLGFFGFSLVCSANYILNDLIDFSKDKNISYKSKKPIASGLISRKFALLEAIFVFTVGITCCVFVSIPYGQITLVYSALGFLYSIYFKKIHLVDVVLLILFYEIRILAGGVLFNIFISFWLVLFAFTMFASLAFLKKYSKTQIEKSELPNGYSSIDSTIDSVFFSNFGVSTAVLSLLTFALYLNSEQVKLVYSQPRLLWFLVPLILFLLLRIWNAAFRGRMHYDPIIFILKDPGSLICLTLMLFSVVAIGQLD